MLAYLIHFDKTGPDVKDDIKLMHCERIDEYDADVSIDFSYIKEQYHFEFPDREIDLYFCYRKIWKEFLAGQAEHCLIMKDGIHITQSFTVIEGALKKLPKGWDIFFPFEKKIHANLGQFKTDGVLTLPYQDIAILQELYLVGSIYFISRQGTARLLSFSSMPASGPTQGRGISVCFYNTNWYYPTSAIIKERVDKERNAVINFNSWSPADKASARKLLKILSDSAFQNQIDLILHGGSLLGYIRHGGIIPWDDDIDLGIEKSQLNKLLEWMSRNPYVNFNKFTEERTGIDYYKFWLAESALIPNWRYGFPFIDLWIYDHDENDILFKNGFIFRNAMRRSLIEVTFEEAIYKIPHNATECLDGMYKDWRQLIRIYPWSHRLETIVNFPLQLEITVDAAGRMV